MLGKSLSTLNELKCCFYKIYLLQNRNEIIHRVGSELPPDITNFFIIDALTNLKKIYTILKVRFNTSIIESNNKHSYQ